MTGTTEKKRPRFTFDRPQHMTSGKIHRDPDPWVFPDGLRWDFPVFDNVELPYEPRPEYDNHDPIIASFRMLYARATPEIRANAAVHYLASVRDMGIALGMTEKQRDHARRILRRVARDLTKG